MSFVGAPIADHARRRADETALAASGGRLTWADLAATVEAIARQTAAQAPGGGRILLDLKDPSDLLVSLLAAVRAGQVAVVPDPNWHPELLAALKRATDGAIDPAFIESAADTAEPLGDGPRTEAAFYIGFTSGSTGYPKGFRRTHRSWLASFTAAEEAFGLSARDSIMVPGGLSHSLHLFAAVHGLHMGAQVHLARAFSPRQVLKTMAENGCTTLYATPTQLQLLARAARAARADGLEFPALRRILVSGAKVPEKAREGILGSFSSSTVFEFYGTSETSFVAARSSADGDIPAGSAGRPMPGVEVEIRDDEGKRCETGETGLVWVRSDQLFDGYAFGEDKETSREDGWLTVGDCGWLDDKGYLFVIGRRKRMLVSAGVNVFPEEIERVLEGLPGIEAAAAFGLDDGLRGTRIVAAVSARDEVDEAALRRACLEYLPPIKVPKRIHAVADWPLTAGGKTDLQRLKALVTRRETVS